MPRETTEKTINGIPYRFTALGGHGVRRIGATIAESLIRKSGLANAIEEATQIFIDATSVGIQDVEAGATAPTWVNLRTVFEDKLGGSKQRQAAQGEWFAWAASESGLVNFLDGALGNVAPALRGQLESIFQKAPSGGSTASSSQKD